MMFSEYRVKASPCPECGRFMAAAASLQDGSRPSPGDLSICMYCQALLQFQEDGNLAVAPAEVLADIALYQPRFYSLLLRAQSIAAEMMKGREQQTKETRD